MIAVFTLAYTRWVLVDGAIAVGSGTKLERWALFAEIAGAFAVVLSVAYLALQVSDNNRLLRSQAHYNAFSLGQRPLEMMVENESLAGVIVACNNDPASADAASWEYFYYQHIDGSTPPQLWRGADAYFRQQVQANAGYARFCSEGQRSFDEPFRSYVATIYAAADSAVEPDL